MKIKIGSVILVLSTVIFVGTALVPSPQASATAVGISETTTDIETNSESVTKTVADADIDRILEEEASSSSSSHYVACGKVDRCKSTDVTHLAPDTAEHRVRCCIDPPLPSPALSGWSWKQRGSYCPLSESPPTCPVGNYSTALHWCETVAGGRLCTLEEVTNNCAYGTGCGFDSRLIWTSTAETSPPTSSPTADPTWTTLLFNTFDTGWDDFVSGGAQATRFTNGANTRYTYKKSTGSILLTDNNQMASSAYVNLTDVPDISTYDMLRVKFWYYVRSFENSENWLVEYATNIDGPWTKAKDYIHKVHFENEDYGFDKVELPVPSPGSQAYLRFRSDASGTGDYLYIDNVEIQGKDYDGAEPSPTPSVSPTGSPSSRLSSAPSGSPTDAPSSSPSAHNACAVDNGGCDHICTDVEGGVELGRTCSCNPGYALSGETSCIDTNECATDNGGCDQICQNFEGGRECSCNTGYTLIDDATCRDDDECEDDTDDCAQLCINTDGGYDCACEAGYTLNGDGFSCDDIDECASNPCGGNSTGCTDEVNDYFCTCKPGFTGKNCDINIDECESSPCVNGACIDKINDFDCNCDDTGFTGDLCEVNIDFCANPTNPCIHGTCEEIPEGTDYECDCDGTGYEGKDCDVEINECDSSPCQNNGTCTDLINDFSCACSTGWTGDTCADDVDECSNGSHNCHQDATCTNIPGSFTCDCNGGYKGDGVETCTALDAVSLACPAVNESTDVNSIDINLDKGGVLTLTSPSSTGTLCTLTEVRTILDGSEDVQVIPIARSYEANDWESSAGATAIGIFKNSGGQPSCSAGVCSITLPPLSDPVTSRYALTAYSYNAAYGLNRKDEIARFLERTTFGVTPNDLTIHDGDDWNDDYRAQFVKNQTNEPMTSHREYFRRRANPKMTHPARNGRPDHPCDPYSRWRRYSFIKHDKEDLVTNVHKILHVESIEDANLPAPVIYEAEGAMRDGFTSSTSRSQYTGASYLDHDWGKYGYVEWTIEVTDDGTYPLSFRYANGDRYNAMPLELIVNNNTEAVLSCPYTLSWSWWRYTKLVDVPLVAGSNTVRVKTLTTASVNIDNLRVGSEPAAILKVDGHNRAIIPGGLFLFNDPSYRFDDSSVAYEFCAINGWSVNKPNGRIEIKFPGVSCGDSGHYIDAMNPPIDFTGYEEYIPGVVFDLPAIDNAAWMTIADEQDDYHMITDVDFLLIGGIENQTICDAIPTVADEGDAPVLARLPDGTWLQWTPQLVWEDNVPGNNIPDGGGETQMVTAEATRCANVPRNFLNEDSCTLSTVSTACTQKNEAAEVDIVLDEATIKNLFTLTEQYVYAIKGLILDDPETQSPCQSTAYTRWEKQADTNCTTPTPLGANSRAALEYMLSTADDSNEYLVDVQFPSGYTCDSVDLSLLNIEIDVDGTCYTQVHPKHLTVYDASEWAKEGSHPGGWENIKKWAICAVDPTYTEGKVVECDGGRTFPGWYLEFPLGKNGHDMARWNMKSPGNWVPIKYGNDGTGPGSRFGDTLAFRDLANDNLRDAVNNNYGAGIVTCGSIGEVGNEPTYGAMFDSENEEERTTGGSTHEQQKAKIWTMINAFEGTDQLRQRMAWALSQILTIVPGNIDDSDETELYVNYYDIFVRNAFGSYRDILEEISYSPLQAEHLTYLASKSHAYIFQDEDKRVSSADENFAREIMQLFTTGLEVLNKDGSPKLDENGRAIQVYDNEDIMSFARGWTGFQRHTARGNIESHDNSNRIDPMYIVHDWRDRFPKTDLTGGYIGDGYPLCTDMPDKMFLRKGAKYRLLGANPLPELIEDNPDFANPDLEIKRFVLDDASPAKSLYAKLNNGGNYQGVVVLDENLLCNGKECEVDTVRVLEVAPDVYYEYVQPPCVQQAFYNGGKGVARYYRSDEGNMCANPELPHASEACCDQYDHDTVSFATRDYRYDGERVTYATAEERCGNLCMFKDMDGVLPKNRRHTGYHWLNTPCNIRAKINSEGYVAIVHYLDTIEKDDIPLHVSDESLNYFKVFWDEDYPSAATNNCGECKVLADGACLCQSNVVNEMVFTSAENTTASDILSSLSIGHMDPARFDISTYTEEQETEKGFTAYVKSPGVYDDETVFKVVDGNGRTRFFRNIKSIVHLEGWESSYTPTIFEAEDATNSTDAVFKNGNSRWTGSGYMDLGQQIGEDQYVQWKVSVPQNVGDVEVNLSFRYTIAALNRPMEVIVNGVTANPLLDFPSTGDWGTYWTYSATVSVTLSAGTNVIRLQSPSKWPTSNITVDSWPTVGDETRGSGTLEQCQGDCDSDSDCKPGLYCFQRSGGFPRVPGCSGIPNTGSRDYCAPLEYRFSQGAPNVDHMLIEGLPSPQATYSFRNAPHFMGLLQDYSSDGIGETNRRDAEYETSAILDHYFYHESTAPFVCIRLIQRFGISNPSPRYIAACSDAFMTGSYTAAGGLSFGSGNYGDLEATAAAINLDREANSPVLDLEPGFGSLREPLMKVIALMRALEYNHAPRENFAELWKTRDRFSQEPYHFPTVFSFFLPEYIPDASPASAASHVSPESQLLDMPSSIEMLNGLFSLIKYGLTDCAEYGGSDYGFSRYPGYGSCYDNGLYQRASGALEYVEQATNTTEIIDELATLVTAGRLSAKNRAIIAKAYDSFLGTWDKGKNPDQYVNLDSHSRRRLALQAMVTTPEFHSNTPIKTADKARPAPQGTTTPGSDYKAIVYLFFDGGADTFNMFPPHPNGCPPENDLYAKYAAIRGNIALTEADMHEIPTTGHNCSSFGLHKELSFLKNLYDQNEAIFVANTGLLATPVDKTNYKGETPVQLFAHNAMQKESKALDLDNEADGTGIIGRVGDALNQNGFSCGTYSIAGNQNALIGEPGVSPSPIILSDSGLSAFDPKPSTATELYDAGYMAELINSVNNATTADSSFMAETWSLKVTEALDQHASLYSALDGASTTTSFPSSGLGKKLSTVTKLMQKRAERGKDRDIFYVSIGGWDTHSYVLDNLNENFATVNAALQAFVDEVKLLGLWDSTALMQFSEFARTLDPNSGPRGDGTGAGSDHGWGGNNFIIGGGLDGGKVLGTYPDDFTENGPRALSRGRMIPETPWDSVWNGVAEWFGVPESELDNVMPMRKNWMPPLNEENILFDKATLFKTGP